MLALDAALASCANDSDLHDSLSNSLATDYVCSNLLLTGISIPPALVHIQSTYCIADCYHTMAILINNITTMRNQSTEASLKGHSDGPVQLDTAVHTGKYTCSLVGKQVMQAACAISPDVICTGDAVHC